MNSDEIRHELSSMAKSLTSEIDTNQRFGTHFLKCVEDLATSVQQRLAASERALVKEKTRIEELMKQCDRQAQSKPPPSVPGSSEFRFPDFSQMDFKLLPGKKLLRSTELRYLSCLLPRGRAFFPSQFLFPVPFVFPSSLFSFSLFILLVLSM